MKPTRKEAVRIRLEEIARKHRGKLTTRAVIEDAKNPKSPLHSCFTWDVKKAAMEYWQEQARNLIRSVRIEVRTSTHLISAPCYVRDPEADTKTGGYTEVTALRPKRDVAREALRYELDRAITALERAQEIAEVLGLQPVITQTLNNLRGIQDKVAA